MLNNISLNEFSSCANASLIFLRYLNTNLIIVMSRTPLNMSKENLRKMEERRGRWEDERKGLNSGS